MFDDIRDDAEHAVDEMIQEARGDMDTQMTRIRCRACGRVEDREIEVGWEAICNGCGEVDYEILPQECPDCGDSLPAGADRCAACQRAEAEAEEEREAEAEWLASRRPLSRQERLERMADAGCDTWAEYGCER